MLPAHGRGKRPLRTHGLLLGGSRMTIDWTPGSDFRYLLALLVGIVLFAIVYVRTLR